jgi:hypothetical protein
MSPRSVGRTQNCGEVDGQVRLDQARAFLEVAELVGTEDDELATPSVAMALAVRAGIAAADAACCTVLGRRTRNPPHAARPQRVQKGFHRSRVEVGGLDVRVLHPASQLPRQCEDLLDAARCVTTL